LVTGVLFVVAQPRTDSIIPGFVFDFGEAQAAALCSKAMNTEAGQDKPDNARFELDYQLSLP